MPNSQSVRVRRRRGFTLLQTIISLALSAGIFGVLTGVYVTTVRGFAEQQSRAYMQSGVRSHLDRIGRDVRAAQAILPATNINGTNFAANNGTSGNACLILKVPAQDVNGLLVYGGTGTNANTLATDTIVYQRVGSQLRCTVSRAVNVTTPENAVRSSYRANQSSAILANDVSSMTLLFRDNAGASLSTADIAAGKQAVTLDVALTFSKTTNSVANDTTSLTGIRLRNAHGGGLTGTVKPVAVGATVQAVYQSSVGPYPAGTVIGTATTDGAGKFALPGLVNGDYTLKVTTTSGKVTETNQYTVANEQCMTLSAVPITL